MKLSVVAIATLSSALALIPTVATATPTVPKAPTVGSVQQQLTKLAVKNTMLIEQFDQAQVDVAARQLAADAALRTAQQAQAAVDKASVLLGATATAQYENGSFSTTGALLSSDSGQAYLDHLQTLQAMSTHAAQVIAEVTRVKAISDAATRHAKDLLGQATAKRDAMMKQRANVQRQVDAYTTLLATMTVTQRTAYQQAAMPSVSNAQASVLLASLVSSPATANDMKAVRFALKQVGKPYVYGSAGPGSYDCSGLTMASWAQAGVNLPHSSEQQFTLGRAVGAGSLRPGDLLFFYGPPPGHVTIYVGGGMMVSAPQPGEDVKIARLSDYNSSYVGARRVG